MPIFATAARLGKKALTLLTVSDSLVTDEQTTPEEREKNIYCNDGNCFWRLLNVTKVALFDFDNTVARGDSIALLLKHDLKHHPWHALYFIKVGILYLLFLLHLISFEKQNQQFYFQLME